jgi:hypothetical protein
MDLDDEELKATLELKRLKQNKSQEEKEEKNKKIDKK